MWRRAALAALLALALPGSDAGAQFFGAGRSSEGFGHGHGGGGPFLGPGFGLGPPFGAPGLDEGPPDNDAPPPPRKRPRRVEDAQPPIRARRPPDEEPRPRPLYPAPIARRAPPTQAAAQKAKRPPALLALPARPPALATDSRYREGEVLVETRDGAANAAIAAIARRHRLVEVEAAPIALLGAVVRLWRIPDARRAASVIAELASEGALARVQPDYLFATADEPAPRPAPLAQYALEKMKVAPDAAPSGAPVRVAVIDTAVDETHPDLAGVVTARFDALSAKLVSRGHGTAMAGGIAANGRLRGVDPRVKILSARAFDSDGVGGALGSTLSILKALDWAVASGARIVNMSFAGPDDPALRDALAAADRRGVVLVSAAGNLGPSAPPQYPGADPHVIAATATDSNDKRFAGANVGPYIAISAPGVDVILTAPGGGYALETGTSVSSALVAGVIGLMMERKPGLTPEDARAGLSRSAHPLGERSQFGAGLVDAAGAAPP